MTRHDVARWASLLLSAGVIGVLTLTPSSGTTTTAPFFCFDCGAWLQDGLDNLLLFAPLGLTCAAFGLRPRHAAAASLACSFVIEALQYLLIPGRDSAAADLVTNGLGGYLGALTWQWRLWWPSRAVARRIAIPAAIASGLTLGAAGHWFSPRVPDGPYFPSLDPATGPFPSPAQLLEATWNGRPLRCCPAPDWKRLQREVEAGVVDVRIRAQLLAAPTAVGRLVTVWDDRSVPVAVVGVDSRGVWGAFATVGQTAGGRDFAVAAPAKASWTRGDTIDVSLRGDRGAWSIRLTHAGTTSEGIVRQSPVLAGYYFLPGFGMAREPLPLWRWLVTQLSVVVVALWSARARRRSVPLASATVVTGVAVLVGMPWAFPSTLITELLWMLGTFALVATITTQVSRRTNRPEADRGSAP
jgi:hypothetical protein